MTRRERAYTQMCIFDRGSLEYKELEEEVPCMSCMMTNIGVRMDGD